MEQTPQRQQARVALAAVELSRTHLAAVVESMGTVGGDFGITVSPPELDRAGMTLLGKPYTLQASILGTFADGFETWLSVKDPAQPDLEPLIRFPVDSGGNTDAAGASQSSTNKFGNKSAAGADRAKPHRIDDPEHVALMGFAMLSAAIARG